MQFRSSTLLAVLLVAVPVTGFSSVAHSRSRSRSHSRSRSRSVALGLTSDEALARARASHGVASNDEAPAPVIFEDSVLQDMQQALLTLELRVKEGPGSLSALQVEELDGQLQRIMDDMRVNQHKKPVKPERTAEAAPAPVAPAQQALATPAPTSNQPEFNDEDGPMYDGKGGMGLSRGTSNTYLLEGMDEMSPEEYRDKLQKSVSDRQDKRKKSGAYGNRQSWDYFQTLTGEIEGPLKRPKAKKSWKVDASDSEE